MNNAILQLASWIQATMSRHTEDKKQANSSVCWNVKERCLLAFTKKVNKSYWGFTGRWYMTSVSWNYVCDQSAASLFLRLNFTTLCDPSCVLSPAACQKRSHRDSALEFLLSCCQKHLHTVQNRYLQRLLKMTFNLFSSLPDIFSD